MNKNVRNWSSSVLITLLVLGISYVEVRILSYSSFGFSISFNFLLMAWYSILFNLFKPKMDWRYFQDQQFEQEGKLYKYFGVNFYRRILVLIGWEKMHRQKNPMKANLTTLKARDYNTRESEVGHLIIAIIVFAFTIWFAKSIHEAKWLIIMNLFLNIYPIIVQRYNRPRYSRVIGIGLRRQLIP